MEVARGERASGAHVQARREEQTRGRDKSSNEPLAPISARDSNQRPGTLRLSRPRKWPPLVLAAQRSLICHRYSASAIFLDIPNFNLEIMRIWGKKKFLILQNLSNSSKLWSYASFWRNDLNRKIEKFVFVKNVFLLKSEMQLILVVKIYCILVLNFRITVLRYKLNKLKYLKENLRKICIIL